MSTTSFTMYHADCVGNAANCLYPHKVVVTDAASMKAAMTTDYVFSAFKNNYRSIENFLTADALAVDCDNDHSDCPEAWVTPDTVAAKFQSVAFAVHYSRHHNLQKGDKSPRPRFHVIFPIDAVTDSNKYAAMKTTVQRIFPYFDTKALDAARFFFGTEKRAVEFRDGSINLTQFLEEYEENDELLLAALDDVICEGTRNTSLSRFAGRTLKRYGDTEEAHQRFLQEAEKCVPPLPDSELQTIWHSAISFYKKVHSQPDYISPEKFNATVATLKPDDYSDCSSPASRVPLTTVQRTVFPI